MHCLIISLYKTFRFENQEVYQGILHITPKVVDTFV